MRRTRLVLLAGMLASVACGPESEERIAVRRDALPAPIPAAYCEAEVDGVGSVDTELDYLPHVISCENGGADIEALKAQAVAARSVLYWTLGTHGSICDSQGCQVYSCANEPLPIHYEAVAATSGEYLAYNGNLTYAFYVAGDSGVTPPECVGDDAAASTEHWITYNEGKSGTMVEQTELGFVHDPADSGYGQNRGCQGQWGARCLEEVGYDYVDILRFYYGEDVELLQASGPCIEGGGATSSSSAGGAGGMGEGGMGDGGDGGDGGAASGSGGTNLNGVVDGVRAPGGDSGCGCRVAGQEAPRPQRGAWAWLLLAAAVLMRRRS